MRLFTKKELKAIISVGGSLSDKLEAAAEKQDTDTDDGEGKFNDAMKRLINKVASDKVASGSENAKKWDVTIKLGNAGKSLKWRDAPAIKTGKGQHIDKDR